MSQSRPQVERVILEYEARTSSALSDIERIDDATENLEARIERLSRQDVTVNADVNLTGSVLSDLEALDSASYTPEIDPTVNDAPIDKVKDLDSEKVTPEIDAQETTEGKAILDRLQEIRDLDAIQIALDIQSQGGELLQTVVNLLGESEAAAARLTAQIGADLPDAEQRINDIFAATGAARADVAGALATGVQLGIDPDDLDAAVVAATNLSTIFGGDITENLRTAQQLVKTGLVPDIQEAFDLLTAGNQAGLNADGGLAGTLTEYASTIRQAGLDGSEALGLIQSGLDAGFDNADRVLDAVREFGIRANDTGDANAQAALDTLGLPTPDEARASGGETGAAYLQSVLDAIQAAPADEQRSLTTALFGTQAEDFGLDTLLSLDPVNEFFDTIEGRATDASAAFNDTLGATVATFFREAQVSIENFLNNSTFRQTLDDFKANLQGTLDALQSGESLPDAIEIGFRIPGFSDQVDRIQSAIGNFVISLLEMIANVQSFLGKDNSGTQAEIARLSANQFAFDVQSVDPTEIGGLVRTALERGVSESDLAGLIDTAIQEQLAAGNVGNAQAIADGAGLQSATVTGFFAGVQTGTETLQQGIDESLASFQLRVATLQRILENSGQAVDVQVNPIVDTTESQAAIDAAATELRTQFDDAFNEGNLTEALTLAEQLGDPATLEQVQFYAQQMRDEFNAALAEGNTDAALDAAQYLPDDAELQAAAQANATAFTTAFNDALSTGDTTTATAIANLLGDETLLQQIDDYREKISEVKDGFDDFTAASEGVSTTVTGVTSDIASIADSSEAMKDGLSEHATAAGAAMTAMSDEVEMAVRGNSIVPDIESILTAAEENLPEAGSYAKMFAADLQALDRTGTAAMLRLRGEIAATAAAAASLIASLSGVPSSVGGAGGGNTTINVNNNVTNNSAAAAAASQADTDSAFRGNPY
jgi:hypothetical protein